MYPYHDPFPQGMMEEIEQILSLNDRIPCGCDSYDEIFNSRTMFPLQRRRELEKMIRLARSINPQVVMEIGTDKGGSLFHWCKSIDTVQRVIACEIRGTPFMDQFEKSFSNIEFCWVEGSSLETSAIQQVWNWLALTKIDVLFIDGDKSYFDKDFLNYVPMMSKNGIVFMHDITHDPMKSVFEDISIRYRTEIIHDTTEAVEELERQKKGEPALTAHQHWLRYWGKSSCGVGAIYLSDKSIKTI